MWSSPPGRYRTRAYVACRSVETSVGTGVSYQDVTWVTSGRCSSLVSAPRTAVRKAGSSTVRVGLEYSTSTSASCGPSCWTTCCRTFAEALSWSANPPLDSEPKTPVPQVAPTATRTAAAASTTHLAVTTNRPNRANMVPPTENDVG